MICRFHFRSYRHSHNPLASVEWHNCNFYKLLYFSPHFKQTMHKLLLVFTAAEYTTFHIKPWFWKYSRINFPLGLSKIPPFQIHGSILNEQQIINKNYTNMFGFSATIFLSVSRKIAPSILYTPFWIFLDNYEYFVLQKCGHFFLIV